MPFTSPSPPASQSQPSTTGNPHQEQPDQDQNPELHNSTPYTYRLLPTWKPHRLPSGRIEYAEAGVTWRRIPLPQPPMETETETEDLEACLRRIHRTSRAWQARWWRANGRMFAYEQDARGQRTRRMLRDRRGAMVVIGRDEVVSSISGAGADEKRAEKKKEREDEKRAEKEREEEDEGEREIEAAEVLMQLRGYRIDGRRKRVSGGDGDEGERKKKMRRRRSSGGVSPKSKIR